jgi:hypothetical protein
MRGQFYGAVAISLALHAVLLVAVARASFLPQAKVRDRELLHMLVTLTRHPSPTVDKAEEEPGKAPLAVPEVRQVIEANTTPTQVMVEEVKREAETKAPEFTPQVLRSAVSSFLERQRGTFTADWIAECEIFRKEHGTRDCEEIRKTPDHFSASARAGRTAGQASFAGVTRPVRHALLTEKFERDNVLMKELMKTPGVQGTLAKERHFLNREILGYLNGNPSPYGPAFQFNCKGGPCVYEFSETVFKKPDTPVAENEFRVVPALFGSQR